MNPFIGVWYEVAGYNFRGAKRYIFNDDGSFLIESGIYITSNIPYGFYYEIDDINSTRLGGTVEYSNSKLQFIYRDNNSAPEDVWIVKDSNLTNFLILERLDGTDVIVLSKSIYLYKNDLKQIQTTFNSIGLDYNTLTIDANYLKR